VKSAALELRTAPERDPGRHERVIGPPRPGGCHPELRKYGRRILPGARHSAEEGAVASPRIPDQGAQIGDDGRPEGIEVEVPDEFEEIRLFLHHDGLLAVLEEMACAPIAAIEASSVAGEQRPHGSRKWSDASPDQEMSVIREQCPGVDGEPALLRQHGEPRDEVRAVRSPRKIA
jgi:hypothetical protein